MDLESKVDYFDVLHGSDMEQESLTRFFSADWSRRNGDVDCPFKWHYTLFQAL